MPLPSLQKILYVDDEEDIRTIVQLSLETVGGFTTAMCASGQQALATAPQFRPDLVLLDVMMPDMDGPTTLRHLRADPLLQNTPVIFMTAKAQPQEVITYKRLGAIDVITKPFDPMSLPEVIRTIWAYHLGAGLYTNLQAHD